MRGGRGIIVGVLGLVVIAGGAVLGWFWFRPTTPKIDADDVAQVAQGHSIYVAQCARCHGVNLEGQQNWRERQANGRLPAPPHDATGHTWHHPDSALFGITKNGIAEFAPPGYQSDMPAFEDKLSDEDIAAVLAYIKSKWPPEVRARQERINEQAKGQ